MELSKRGLTTIIIIATFALAYASICFLDKAIDLFCLAMGV